MTFMRTLAASCSGLILAAAFTPVRASVGTPTLIGNGDATMRLAPPKVITTVAVPAGAEICVVIQSINNSNVFNAPTDTASNSYHQVFLVQNAANTGSVYTVYCAQNVAALASGSSINVTWPSGTAEWVVTSAFYVTGILASGTEYDAIGTPAGGTGTGTISITSGSLAQPTNELVCGVTDVANGHGDSFTESAGFSTVTSNGDTGLAQVRVSCKAATASPVTYSPQISPTTSRTYDINIFGLKGAPPPGRSNPSCLLLTGVSC